MWELEWGTEDPAETQGKNFRQWLLGKKRESLRAKKDQGCLGHCRAARGPRAGWGQPGNKVGSPELSPADPQTLKTLKVLNWLL